MWKKKIILKRTREKYRNGYKESGHGANTSDGRIPQEFFDSIYT